jgi:hypothetical protein
VVVLTLAVTPVLVVVEATLVLVAAATLESSVAADLRRLRGTTKAATASI